MPITKEEIEKYQKAYNEGHPLIDDSEFDALLEEYLKNHDESERPYLRSSQTDSISDIVGTLPKAFGVTKPMRPGLLTYEEFVKKNPVPLDDYSIILQPKFDGISIAYDIIADRFYTRGDMTNNESVDVTDLFKHHSFHNEWTKGYDAIKFEAIMPVEVYEELYSSKYKRPRDAAQAAISSRNVEACKDITLIPLRKIKNKKLYVADILKRLSISFEQMNGGIPDLTYDSMDSYIANLLEDNARLEFNGLHYECDGVVASHCKPLKTEIVSKEVAIKILNLQKQTTLKGIEFSMGIAGRITPVALVEDTKFGNVTVNRISLSNLERLRELNLNLGDTVNIMYNIIPYLVSSEHDGTLGKVQIPNTCPICGSQLTNIGPNTLGCGNPNCYASNVGNVVKYVQNMKMFGISTRTIEAMFETGHIHSISSLYEINYNSLSALEGFGVVSADNVRKSIEEASTDVDPIRWLSALPCKNVERRKWEMIVYTNPKYRDNLVLGNVLKQVCSQSTPNQFFDAFGIHPNNDKIVGIGPMTMNIIITDIQRAWEDIMKIIPHITFKATTNIIDLDKPLAVLSGTRDGQVISKLESLGYRVSDKFSKDAKLVVIPNPMFTSSKVDKAKKYGIEVKTVNQIQNMGV